MTEYIRDLIKNNKTYEFYHTKEWRKIRKQKRIKEHYECERCRAKGVYKHGDTIHHKKYLKDYPELALNFNNLECLCKDCHYQEHHKIADIEGEFSEKW